MMSAMPRALSPAMLARASFDPRSISGLTLWLDPEILTETTGQAVAAIADRAGGVTYTQSTAERRPTITSLNNRKALAFDGNDDGMLRTGGNVTINTPTIAWAMKATQDDFSYLLGHYGGATQSGVYIGGTVYDKLGVFTGATLRDTAAVVYGSAVVWVVTGAKIWKNGTEVSYFSTGTPASFIHGVYGARDQAGWKQSINGIFGQLLVWNKVLSDSERAKVTSWLASLYGVTI